jgi:hypothetical protein
MIMYRCIFLTTIIAITLNSCSTQQQVVTSTIKHDYYNLSFSPEHVQKNLTGQVEVTMLPIDAGYLNRITSEAARRDGQYEKELVNQIEKQKRESQGLSGREKSLLNAKIKAIDEVNEMERNNLIPLLAAYHLTNYIWYGDLYSKNGIEIMGLSTYDRFPSTYNPFKINQNYLSVFQVTFENLGIESHRISLNDFHIISGEELLKPLGFAYFENILQNNSEKMQNVYRMSMPDELLLTSNQRITKYLAVPAINPKHELLNIQLIQNEIVSEFVFSIKQETETREYVFEKFQIHTNLRIESIYDVFFVVCFENGVAYANGNPPVIYVEEEYKNMNAEIFAVAIRKDGSDVVHGKLTDFKFRNKRNNMVVVDF